VAVMLSRVRSMCRAKLQVVVTF